MPRSLEQFGYTRIEVGAPILAYRALKKSLIWQLEFVYSVLDAEKTYLGFLHKDDKEFSMMLFNPRMHRARLEAAVQDRRITQEGPQAFIDFEHPTTRWEAVNEVITGLTPLMRPEYGWIRRRVRGPVV